MRIRSEGTILNQQQVIVTIKSLEVNVVKVLRGAIAWHKDVPDRAAL
jgi:hypothetical protein